MPRSGLLADLIIMAIIRSLAIGKSRKSAGDLTFRTVRGRTIGSQKRGPNPAGYVPSSKQFARQADFIVSSMFSTMLSPILDIIQEKTKFGTARNRVTASIARSLQLSNPLVEEVMRQSQLGLKSTVREWWSFFIGGDISRSDLLTGTVGALESINSGYGSSAPIISSISRVTQGESYEYTFYLTSTAKVGDMIGVLSMYSNLQNATVYYTGLPETGSLRHVLTATEIAAGTSVITVPIASVNTMVVRGFLARSAEGKLSTTPQWEISINPQPTIDVDQGGGGGTGGGDGEAPDPM